MRLKKATANFTRGAYFTVDPNGCITQGYRCGMKLYVHEAVARKNCPEGRIFHVSELGMVEL